MSSFNFTLFVKLFNLVGLIILVNAFCVHCKQAEDEMAKFDNVMKMVMQYAKAPGAQLAVAKGGQLKYFKAFGVANRDTGEPLTTHHVMRMASISKVFTGTTILKLIQEGKLSLEDKPFRLLESLQPPAGAVMDTRLLNITIRNLLQHTGGWNRTLTLQDVGSLDVALYASQSLGRPLPPTTHELIRFVKGVPLNFDPASAMEYANIGYLVLGRVIEKVTGMSYIQYLQQYTLRPLGITGIKVGRTRVEDLRENEARYYGIDGEDTPWVSVFPEQGFVNRSYGGTDIFNSDSMGGLIGSARDIVRFVDHIDGLRQPAILGKEMVYAMLNEAMPSKRGTAGDPLWDHSQGLDVFVSVDDKGKITSFQHNGALIGCRSYFMRLMEENITFAVLLNTLPSVGDFDYVVAGNLSGVAKSIAQWPVHSLNPS